MISSHSTASASPSSGSATSCQRWMSSGEFSSRSDARARPSFWLPPASVTCRRSRSAIGCGCSQMSVRTVFCPLAFGVIGIFPAFFRRSILALRQIFAGQRLGRPGDRLGRGQQPADHEQRPHPFQDVHPGDAAVVQQRDPVRHEAVLRGSSPSSTCRRSRRPARRHTPSPARAAPPTSAVPRPRAASGPRPRRTPRCCPSTASGRRTETPSRSPAAAAAPTPRPRISDPARCSAATWRRRWRR